MRLSHEEVKKRIVDELYWDSRVDASEVSIDFADDRAVLRGMEFARGSSPHRRSLSLRRAAGRTAWTFRPKAIRRDS